VAGEFLLGIRLRFHNHTPQQLAIGLAFYQQAADEVGGNQLGGAGEEGLGKVLGGRGGYGSGLKAISGRQEEPVFICNKSHTCSTNQQSHILLLLIFLQGRSGPRQIPQLLYCIQPSWQLIQEHLSMRLSHQAIY